MIGAPGGCAANGCLSHSAARCPGTPSANGPTSPRDARGEVLVTHRYPALVVGVLALLPGHGSGTAPRDGVAEHSPPGGLLEPVPGRDFHELTTTARKREHSAPRHISRVPGALLQSLGPAASANRIAGRLQPGPLIARLLTEP